MANANLGDLVTTTLRNRRGQLADNILNHNAVLRFLNREGHVDAADGGRTLVEELEYAENQTFKYYSGYEVLDISPSDVFDSAEYEWKQAAVVVSVSGAEERKNAGKEQSLRLVDRRIKNAEKTMMNNLSIGVYSDGTGASGKQIAGCARWSRTTPRPASSAASTGPRSRSGATRSTTSPPAASRRAPTRCRRR